MPPVPRNENNLSRLLNKLIPLFNKTCCKKTWVNYMKEVNCLIILSFVLKIFTLCNSKVNIWRETNPVLVTLERCVPG